MLCGEDTHQHVQQKIALPPRNKSGAKKALLIPAMEAPQYLCESSKYSLALIKRKFRDRPGIHSIFLHASEYFIVFKMHNDSTAETEVHTVIQSYQ